MPTLYPTGLARITVPYVVSGITHRVRAYGRNVQASGGTYKINSRALDENDILWEDAADRFATALGAILAGATTFPDFILEKWTGALWQTLATATSTGVGNGGSVQQGTQYTIVFRDTQLKKLKVVLLEGKESAPQHFTSPTGGSADFDSTIACFLSTHPDANDPYVWMVSHRGLYLSTSPFVGATVALNRKVRRRRGLA